MRGLVLVVVDTARLADIASSERGRCYAFLDRLRRIGLRPVSSVCGSFPTVPMRTDLLTGRLAFLSGEWARPRPQEETLLHILRRDDVTCSLVTDNYVALLPSIGGMLINYFDSVQFIRGSGSDPFQPITPAHRSLAHSRCARLPTRNVHFEAQFLANIESWERLGGPPFVRVFRQAARTLEAVRLQRRFLLWLDCFGLHEPWISGADLQHELRPTRPILPPYQPVEDFPRDSVRRMKGDYEKRIEEFFLAAETFLEVLERCISEGDTGAVVISDHGFLFGEYGFVGKPAETPLGPELSDLLCWVSPQFDNIDYAARATPLQPHELYGVIAENFGIDSAGKGTAGEVALFARNSPRSPFLSAIAGPHLVIMDKRVSRAGVVTVDLKEIQRHRCLWDQGEPTLLPEVGRAIQRSLQDGVSPWLVDFKDLLQARL